MHRTRYSGFTLIELMVVVAIVAVLGMVALPTFRDHLIRGQLTDGTNGLATIRAQMERYYLDNRTYASVSATIVTPCAATDNSVVFGNFRISCAAPPDATTYTLQAVGSGASAGFTFTLNQLDVHATTAAARGWNTCANQWLTRRGQTC